MTRDADGTWHVKAGARVRVRADDGGAGAALPRGARRSAARGARGDEPGARDDRQPARSATATSRSAGPAAARPGYWWWWTRPWYEHQNLRDERVEAFASLLWEGVYNYTYVARATTPGTFVVPPPKAEEMYTPETFGRGASDRVIVE